MQEITGAKPVRDTNFIFALKALAAMHSLGKRIQLGATPSEGSTFSMKKLTADQFWEYAADPLATGKKVRKWCGLPDDRYYSVATWPESRAGEVRVTELHRVVRSPKVSKSDQP